MTKKRLDVVLVERGLAESREQAKALVMAGLVPGYDKPGQQVGDDATLTVDRPPRFVSRGGEKLAHALDKLGVDPGGKGCLDLGASTGGFTDCLLQRGASRVVALDVGRGQLDWSLRNDERVTVLEGVNVRALEPSELPFRPSLVVADVSFISLAKVLGPIRAAIADDGEVLAMVKPQFELGRGRVGKGGVVRSGDDRREAVRNVIAAAAELGLAATGVAAAGVPGPKGNQEYFVRFAPGADRGDLDAEIERVVR